MPRSRRYAAELDTDQLETAAIRTRTWIPVLTAFRDDMMAETLVDETEVARAPLDVSLEGKAGNVVAEVARRVRLLREGYPFEFDGQRQALRYSGSRTLVYEFCLAVAQAPSLSEGQFARLPREFERLTGEIVQAFLGDGARWYRAAWPPDGDRPSTFRGVIDDLNSRTGEWWWRAINERPDPDPKNVKDGGLDLVVWKYPEDGRAGGITLIGQCACGNDWPTKTSDLRIENHAQWIPHPTTGGQIRFLAMPFHVGDDLHWMDKSMEAAVIFDRVRLSLLAERYGLATAARLTPFIQLVLQEFGARTPAQATNAPQPRDAGQA
jgi:hypothetical protein